MFLNTLSGRFLILTTLFVMLAEVLIFVPSIARFREDYLLLRLERAQIASLALLANNGMVSDSLEKELLANAGVQNSDPAIRAELQADARSSAAAADQSFTDRVLSGSLTARTDAKPAGQPAPQAAPKKDSGGWFDWL